ncbi:unnamed protein product [Ilex paraguariensis]|uniref:Scarecrow-like protein 14 n=1 Tax=Ilex paraguariensis TaxID=185542 RepID=A0ABC8R2C0_9AQUA
MSIDALIQEYPVTMNGSKFNHQSISALPEQNHVNGYKFDHGFKDLSVISNGSIPVDDTPSERNTLEDPDSSDAILKYINQMLMEEEDLDHEPCMFHDCSALLSAEKSFYDVLGEKYPASSNQHPSCALNQYSGGPSADSTGACSSDNSTGAFEYSLVQSSRVNYSFESVRQKMPYLGSSNSLFPAVNGLEDSYGSPFLSLDSPSKNQFDLQPSAGKVTLYHPNDNKFSFDLESEDKISEVLEEAKKNGTDHSPNGSRGKKNHHRESNDYIEEQSNKHLASYAEESEESEMYDKTLLCEGLFRGLHIESNMCDSDEGSQYETRNKLKQSEGSKRGRPRGKKQGIGKKVVDLTSLLTQCAEAVARYDLRTANELLKRIRQHSSISGDGTERLAHYFAEALEARLAGTGTTLYTAFTTSRISAAEILKAYQLYITACPFKKMSIHFANKSIRKLAAGAARLHIIDFGILYGFQWPCLIQTLSERPGGPPKLCITGIDLPQSGFRPTERVEKTGRRLANYCKRFSVPFEYNVIAMKWDTIQLDDLKIDGDELLVVNCLYRLENVPDHTIAANSPRDAVLNLIKRINPDLFIHGVVNGTYNTPFFGTRFREALFHFSAQFDMFDATVLREDQDRLLFEKEVFGRDAMNVIACEGTERVERPETYRQWQIRNVRARFRQLPLDQEIVKDVRGKVKSHYHKDFVVDEDGNWMLQGWRGRVIYALSCWKPVQE